MNPSLLSSESEDEGYRSPLMTSQEFLDKEKEKDIVAGLLQRIAERKKFVASVKQMMKARALRDHANKEKMRMERKNCFKNQQLMKKVHAQAAAASAAVSTINHQNRERNSYRYEDHQEYRRAEKREYDSSRNRNGHGQRREDEHYRTNSSLENRDNHYSSRSSRSTNGYNRYEQKERDYDHRRSSNTSSRWPSSNKEDNEFNDRRSQSQSSTKRRREDEAGRHHHYQSQSPTGSNVETRDFPRNERERPGYYENDFNSRVDYFIDNKRSNEADDSSRISNININHSLSVQRSLSEIRRIGSSENRSYSNGTRNGGGIRSGNGNGTQSDYELSYRSTQNERKDIMPNSQQQPQQSTSKRVLYTSHYYNDMLQKQRDSYSRSSRYFRPN